MNRKELLQELWKSVREMASFFEGLGNATGRHHVGVADAMGTLRAVMKRQRELCRAAKVLVVNVASIDSVGNVVRRHLSYLATLRSDEEVKRVVECLTLPKLSERNMVSFEDGSLLPLEQWDAQALLIAVEDPFWRLDRRKGV